MKKLITLLLFLYCGALLSQDMEVDAVTFGGAFTTTQRDAITVAYGKHVLVYNSDTEQLEIGDSDGTWIPIGSSSSSGVVSLNGMAGIVGVDLTLTDNILGITGSDTSIDLTQYIGGGTADTVTMDPYGTLESTTVSSAIYEVYDKVTALEDTQANTVKAAADSPTSTITVAVGTQSELDAMETPATIEVVEDGTVGTDGFVTEISIAGDTIKTVTLKRNGLPDLVTNFTDNGGDGSGSGDGNDFLNSVTEAGDILTFNVQNQSNPTFDMGAYLLGMGYLTSEVDGSTTNELQTISKSGSTVTLSNGGGSFTDSDTHLSESEVDAYVSDNGYLTSEVDGSTSNELQTITKTGSTVTLSNGGGSFTDDDSQLSETEVDAYVSNNGYYGPDTDGVLYMSRSVSGVDYSDAGTDSGFYYLHPDYQGTNNPSSYGGLAHMTAGAAALQLYMNTSSDVYIRNKWSTNSWSSWGKLWHSGNDGSGSGLDADTVDGLGSSLFIRSDTSDSKTAGYTRYNDGLSVQFGTDNDSNIFSTGSETKWSLNVGNLTITNNGTTISTLERTSGNFMVTGSILADTDKTVWHSGNDGSGTGMDTDMLDGIQSSQFIRSDTNDSKTAGYTRFNDNIELQFGSGDDFNIRHTGVNTYMDMITGSMYLQNNGTTKYTFNSAGNFTATGQVNASAFYENSDRRLKKNIQEISPTFRSFEFIDDPGTVRYGVIAQEVEVTNPELVTTKGDGLKAVNYIDLLILKVAELENEVQRLKSKLDE